MVREYFLTVGGICNNLRMCDSEIWRHSVLCRYCVSVNDREHCLIVFVVVKRLHKLLLRTAVCCWSWLIFVGCFTVTALLCYSFKVFCNANTPYVLISLFTVVVVVVQCFTHSSFFTIVVKRERPCSVHRRDEELSSFVHPLWAPGALQYSLLCLQAGGRMRQAELALVFCLFCGVVLVFLCSGWIYAFVVLGLVLSVLCQEIGCEERLWNDLFCLEWDIKP